METITVEIPLADPAYRCSWCGCISVTRVEIYPVRSGADCRVAVDLDADTAEDMARELARLARILRKKLARDAAGAAYEDRAGCREVAPDPGGANPPEPQSPPEGDSK